MMEQEVHSIVKTEEEQKTRAFWISDFCCVFFVVHQQQATSSAKHTQFEWRTEQKLPKLLFVLVSFFIWSHSWPSLSLTHERHHGMCISFVCAVYLCPSRLLSQLSSAVLCCCAFFRLAVFAFSFRLHSRIARIGFGLCQEKSSCNRQRPYQWNRLRHLYCIFLCSILIAHRGDVWNRGKVVWDTLCDTCHRHSLFIIISLLGFAQETL